MLTAEDVESQVNKTSSFAFQQTASCMQCHATIDEFALIQRNHIWVSSSTSPGNFDIKKQAPKGTEALTLFKLPVTSTSTAFALKNPQGELHFRTFSGDKIRMPITNFAQVGNKFAELEDFYVCAAKRYYKYFTGVDVPLDSEPSDPLERAHLETVKALGFKLMKDSNQSLRTLIGDIFKTEAFQSRNFKTEGVVE